MKITLIRKDITDHGIFGTLDTDNGFSCITLERHDIYIPVGTYHITIYDSPEHGNIPLLLHVPGRSMIEIHEGNFEYNSKGCILVGKSRTDIDGDGYDDIGQSRDTLKQLVKLIKDSQDPVYISIS